MQFSNAGDPVFPPPRRLGLPRLPRFRLRTLLVLIALSAIALGGLQAVRRRQLADDRGQVFSHEDMADFEDLQVKNCRKFALLYEMSSDLEGEDRLANDEQAARFREEAALHSRRKDIYLYRAALKERYRERWWVP